MNRIEATTRPDISYDGDFFLWTQDQAVRLRRSRPAEVDWENVAEEIESLGKSDRRAVENNIRIVLEHLIKWRYQPERRGPSWSDSIHEHRNRLEEIIEDSPSLARVPGEVLARNYARARQKALDATGLPAAAIPEICPFSVEQVLDPDFWPGPV